MQPDALVSLVESSAPYKKKMKTPTQVKKKETDNDEPRIKDVLVVSRLKASDLRPPIYYTAWRLPKISYFGHLAHSHSETSE